MMESRYLTLITGNHRYKGILLEKKEHYQTGTNSVFLAFFCFFFNKIMYTKFSCIKTHFKRGLLIKKLLNTEGGGNKHFSLNS